MNTQSKQKRNQTWPPVSRQVANISGNYSWAVCHSYLWPCSYLPSFMLLFIFLCPTDEQKRKKILAKERHKWGNRVIETKVIRNMEKEKAIENKERKSGIGPSPCWRNTDVHVYEPWRWCISGIVLPHCTRTRLG